MKPSHTFEETMVGSGTILWDEVGSAYGEAQVKQGEAHLDHLSQEGVDLDSRWGM